MMVLWFRRSLCGCSVIAFVVLFPRPQLSLVSALALHRRPTPETPEPKSGAPNPSWSDTKGGDGIADGGRLEEDQDSDGGGEGDGAGALESAVAHVARKTARSQTCYQAAFEHVWRPRPSENATLDQYTVEDIENDPDDLVDTVMFPDEAYVEVTPFQPPTVEPPRPSVSAVVRDPDVGKSMEELVYGRGYPVERHYVTTADGYILGVFRIPYSPRAAEDTIQAQKPVVLLQHGLFDSSTTYVCNAPSQSLAFILADAGWDVWMGNNRGTYYSRNHTTMNDTDPQFWDFTWADMAAHDFPAMIDYILAETQLPSLAYVGHSQGNLQAWAALSLYPALAARLSIVVALGPVAYVKFQRVKVLQRLSRFPIWNTIVNSYLPSSMDPCVDSIHEVALNVCDEPSLQPMCTHIVSDLFGGTTKHLNLSRLAVYLSLAPSSTSAKNVAHFAQMIGHGNFGMFDYGKKGNLLHYHQYTPPHFNLSASTVPTALFSGGADKLSDTRDVNRMRREFRPGIVVKDVVYLGYSHVDLIWAHDAFRLLYPDVLLALKNHTVVENVSVVSPD